jgi:hypothetical protein
MLAEVVLNTGRWHLRVAGWYLATEGDKCRDGNLPEQVLPPISPEELKRATIGGRPAKDLPIDMVRLFRGDCWTEKMLRYVADQINAALPCPAPAEPAPARTTGETGAGPTG